jgi:tetratricopeptide (TPR) repeat protein
MKSLASAIAPSLLVILAAACGGGGETPEPKSQASAKAPAQPTKAVSAETAKGFNDALKEMVDHDHANDWTDATCKQVAQSFQEASSAQKSDGKGEFPEAIYNAGLAYQRCNDDGSAKGQFQKALDLNAQFHRARVQLALYELKEKGDAAIEPVIHELMQAVKDAQFQNVEALVNLAMLQMKRRGTGSDADGANDYDRAKKNLQRALAIDDGYQPAFNQLALYYLELAKAKAGRGGGRRNTAIFARTKRADQQQLELAALVCSQAIRKNPNYAAIHNTAGLIQVELQNINNAVQEFQTAAKLDPAFFEAQMNYAAVNLSFRGFKAAEDAYRAALKIRPNDYEAHLGLALALRGQINDSNFDKNIADAQAELDKCKQIAPDRAETFYNEAILVQEYKAKGGGANAVPALEQAASIFESFVQKAGNTPEFADAVKRSKERAQDIRDTVKFIKEGQSEAAIEAAKQEKEQNAPAQEGEDKEGGESPAGQAPAAPAGNAPPAPAPAPAAPAAPAKPK